MPDPSPAAHQAHFQSLERQAEAARLGMWVFLASEVLLFGGLFGLYAGYRAEWPEAFRHGVQENKILLGTLNTVILITSSWLVALSVHALREGKGTLTRALLLGAFLLGAAFLVVKGMEYGDHFAHGKLPGPHGKRGVGADPGSQVFITLYFAMTGLHMLHVIVGMGVLGWFAVDTRRKRGRTTPANAHRLELGGMYWHLVDVVWIFLWPMFYLLR